MKITLTDVGKRFNRDWIFRHLNYEFISGNSYAIIGSNGSGKSTLLQVIAGAIAESEGKVSFGFPVSSFGSPGNQQVSPENFFQYISIAAPYMELIEEMSLAEFLQFHQVFKPFSTGIARERIISEIGLEKSAQKHIRYYSSGMKQRVKLAQAIFSDTPVLLLDEPCTNLDEDGINLYHQLIKSYCRDRVVIVSSNDVQEYGFCEERLNIMSFK